MSRVGGFIVEILSGNGLVFIVWSWDWVIEDGEGWVR